MATIIDAFLIRFGLDASAFKKESKTVLDKMGKVKDESGKTGKSLLDQGEKAAQGFSKVRNELLSLIGLFMAGKGVKEFFTSAVQGGMQLNQTARNIGMSASELDRWQKTIERAGGNGQAFVGSMKSLNDQFKEFQTTGKAGPALEVLRSMGVADKLEFKADGSLEASKSIMLIADALHAMPKSQADTLGAALGFDMASIQELELGSAALQKHLDETRPKTQEQIDAEERMAKKLRDLGQKANNVGEHFLTNLAPAIEKVLDWLDKLAAWFDEHPVIFGAIAASAMALSTLMSGRWLLGMLRPLLSIGTGTIGLVRKFGFLKSAIPAIFGVIKASAMALSKFMAGVWLRGVLGPLASVGSGVMGLVGKFGLLKSAIAGAAFGAATFSAADFVAEKLGAKKQNVDEKQDEANWHAATTLEKIQSAPSLILENVADMFGATIIASNARANRIKSDSEYLKGQGRFVDANASAGGVDAAKSGASNAGAYAPLLDLIGKAEGTDKGRGYNESYAYGRWSGGNQNLTGMTLDQIEALQKDMLGRQIAAGIDAGSRSSAVGRYQINRDTLRGLRGQLGLKGDELFSQEMQDRMAVQLAQTRGKTQNGLASIWASLPRSDTAVSAYGQRTGATSEELQYAMSQIQRLPPVGAQAAMGARGYSAPTGSTQSEINIGQITVQTQATDADGIAREMNQAIRNNSLVSQANTGLS